MSTPRELLEDLVRDLDMVVFRLERTPPTDAAVADTERRRTRRDLEQLRDRLEDVARRL
jgi:hypothetical protein